MSYSRWNPSHWYVFWDARSGESQEEQVLACWYFAGDWEKGEGLSCFTYKELAEGSLTELLKSNNYPSEALTSVKELEGYVAIWLKDVREKYGNR